MNDRRVSGFAVLVWASLLTALPFCGAGSQTPPAQDPPSWEPYLLQPLDEQGFSTPPASLEGRRGTLNVPADRSDPAVGTVELAFVRLPSTAARPGPPIVYLAGGPGSSGIESAKGPRLSFLLALRAVADVILLDQRGTGSSQPSPICQNSWSYPTDEPLDSTVLLTTVRERARACAESLRERGHDLSVYNAREIADDLEDLRRALGVPRVHLVATSYGTHLALAAIRRHGTSIGRAVLIGVVGPDQTLKLPRRIQDALERIGPDDGSRGALADAVATVLDRLEEPVTVTTLDPLSGEKVDLRIGKLDLQLATVRALAGSRSLVQLQEAYGKMSEGDFTPLAQDLLAARKSWIGRAMPYAVTCASGISPQRWETVLEQEKEAPLGRWIDFPFPEICSAMGLEELGPEFREPVHASLPVLLISGTLDVRTPRENAEEVLRGLPNGVHLVVEGAGHGDDLMVASPEIGRNVAEFLQGRPLLTRSVAAVPLWERVPPPPHSQSVPFTETLHGVEVSDPYRWLEKGKTPETRWWAEVQNRYADKVLDVLPNRDGLRRELKGLLQLDFVSRPWVRNGRYFHHRRRGGEEFATIVLREGGDGAEQVLLDPRSTGSAAAEASSRSFKILDVSADGRLLVYSVAEGGEEESEIRLLDVDRRQPLPDRLPKAVHFGASLRHDATGLYYSRESAPGEGARLYFHSLGTDPATDRELFGAGYDRRTVVWGNLSDDGRYLVSHALSGENQNVDVYLENVAEGGERLEVVQGLGTTFYGGVLGEKLVLHTTWQAPRGRILTADPGSPGRESWREIVPEREEAVIRTVFGAGGKLFVEYVEDVRSRLLLFDLEGRELGEVSLPALGTLEGIRGHWEQKDVYLTFSSFHVPPTVYRYDTETGELAPWRAVQLSVDPGQFEIRQTTYPSRDGTSVPIFVLHAKGLRRDGSNPVLLTAYGGFGVSLTPSFDVNALAWIRHGGVYAVASPRGGGELGEAWHQAGVREKKQSSVDDLVAAAEWLIDQGYTRPEKLALSGHSNGGLLVAAAMTQRPELFRAVVCSHPLLDMLRYNKFLVARFWLPEYGSPDLPEPFEYLYAYSPYHRLEANGKYPAAFFVTSAGDTRVAPLHAFKMTARMQTLASPERPVLLRYHAVGGHGGEGASLSLRIDQLTETLGFLFWQLGVEPAQSGGAEGSGRAAPPAPRNPAD